MAQFSHEDVMKLWHKGSRENARGCNVFCEGKDLFSYGHHFLLARKMHGNLYLMNSRKYSVSTSKHQTLLWRELSNEIQQGHVLGFSTGSKWWQYEQERLPSIGDILDCNTWDRSGQSITDLYYNLVDTNTHRIKYSMWAGDVDKLLKLLAQPDPGSNPSSYVDQAVIHVLNDEGMDAALAWLKQSGAQLTNRTGHELVAAGATYIPQVGTLRGWYWETWRGILDKAGEDAQVDAACKKLLVCKREADRKAANDFLNNINNHKRR